MKKYGPMSRHIRRIISELVRPLCFESVLDAGCGQGDLLSELLSEFPNIRPHGVDLSGTAIELARAKIPGGHFQLVDIERECLNETFDLVICSEVLEHIQDDVSALRHLASMTKGHLVVSTVQGRTRSFEVQRAGHVRSYGKGELVQKVENAGFRALKVVEWGFPFYSPLYRDFLELTGARGTTGDFGYLRRMISTWLYSLFMLNSSKHGDEIFVLAEPARNPVEAS
jgi:SAM-dependent methyltransferase